MAEEKKVKLRLDVGMSPGAKKSIDDLSNATKKAADEQGRLNKNIEATGKSAGKTAGTYGMAPVDAKPRGPSPHILEAMQRGDRVVKRRIEEAEYQQSLRGRASAMANMPVGGKLGAGADKAIGAGLGRLGAVGGPAAAVAAGAMVTQSAADAMYGAQTAMDVGGTGGDAYRAAVNSNFLTRNTLGLQLGFMDSISGRNYEIEKAQREGRYREAVSTATDRRNMTGRELDSQRRIDQINVSAANRAEMAAGLSGMDRTTLEGETAYRERAARQGIENQANLATEDRIAAQRRVEEIERRRADAADRSSGLWNDLNKAENAANTATDIGGRMTAEADARVLRERLKLANQEELDLINQEKDARRASVEALQREKELRTQLAEVTLREMQQRDAIAASQATRLGGMDDFASGRAIDALEQIQGLSPDQLRNASPFLLGEAQKVAPETLRKMQEEAGKDSPAQQRLRQIAPGEFRDNLDDIPKQAQDAADKQQIETRLNEREIREEVQQTINTKEIAESIVSLINKQIDLLRSEIAANNKMRGTVGG